LFILFHDPATTEIYTLSLHDALPIYTLYSSTNSIRIGNLTSATGYEYYVRQICVRGDTSIWSGPFEFYTAYPLSFFEDFESFTGGGLNNGWFSTTHVDPLWKSGTSTYYGPKQDHTIGAG